MTRFVDIFPPKAHNEFAAIPPSSRFWESSIPAGPLGNKL